MTDTVIGLRVPDDQFWRSIAPHFRNVAQTTEDSIGPNGSLRSAVGPKIAALNRLADYTESLPDLPGDPRVVALWNAQVQINGTSKGPFNPQGSHQRKVIEHVGLTGGSTPDSADLLNELSTAALLDLIEATRRRADTRIDEAFTQLQAIKDEKTRAVRDLGAQLEHEKARADDADQRATGAERRLEDFRQQVAKQLETRARLAPVAPSEEPRGKPAESPNAAAAAVGPTAKQSGPRRTKAGA